MASLSHQRKTLTPILRGALLALSLLLPATSLAATTERIVADWRTGVAIDGFDPVAYFIDARPLPGRAEYEYAWGGVVWRFRNEGNLAAFAANPESYAPQFGGYDPLVVARGVAASGDPQIWLISERRLYFFQSAQARLSFYGDVETVSKAADEKWAQVLKTLVP